MSDNKIVKEHPLAHILRAIADGVPVQAKWDSGGDWFDLKTYTHSLALDTDIGIQYRIKPKPKVKKWRWVVAGPLPDSDLVITCGYYTPERAAEVYHNVIQRIDSTMLEVEAY